MIGSGNGTPLTDLRDASENLPSDFYTTLPLNDDANLLALFDLFDGAQNQPLLTAVFKPPVYSHHIAGTRRYELYLDVVRALTAQWFAPVS